MERNQAQPLVTLRIVWFALILGQVIFLITIVTGTFPAHPPTHSQPVFSPAVFFHVNLAMLFTIVPVTFVIRALLFRRFRTDAGLPPRIYSTGNIVFWAGCESVSFTALVFALLDGSLTPTIWIAVVALALQALTFPQSGKMAIP